MERGGRRCSASDLKRAEKVSEIILADLSRNITIDELAKVTGTNSTTLRYCFKEMYGMTLHHYSLLARLEHSKKLLCSTDYSVQHVAELTGYTEGTNFARIFIKYNSCSPTEWRKNKNDRKDSCNG